MLIDFLIDLYRKLRLSRGDDISKRTGRSGLTYINFEVIPLIFNQRNCPRLLMKKDCFDIPSWRHQSLRMQGARDRLSSVTLCHDRSIRETRKRAENEVRLNERSVFGCLASKLNEPRLITFEPSPASHPPFPLPAPCR